MPLPDVSHLRNYGVAFSEAEGAWSPEVKATMRRVGKNVVMRHLSLMQKLRFFWRFTRAQRRASELDLSDLRARGMTNGAFLDQQLEYLAMFAALAEVLGTGKAVCVMQAVMDESAREPLRLALPEAEGLAAFDDPLQAWRAYVSPAPQAARVAGCQELVIVEDGPDAVQFDVKWCVWLELARKMGVPEGCLPNCYSDDLVFPEFFAALGIRYRRTGTLAQGAACCDFRFERLPREAEPPGQATPPTPRTP